MRIGKHIPIICAVVVILVLTAIATPVLLQADAYSKDLRMAKGVWEPFCQDAIKRSCPLEYFNRSHPFDIPTNAPIGRLVFADFNHDGKPDTALDICNFVSEGRARTLEECQAFCCGGNSSI